MVESTEVGTRTETEDVVPVERLRQDNEAMRLEVLEARHRLLVNRDHVIGTEAEIGRLNRDVIKLQVELNDARKKIRALQKRKSALQQKVGDLQTRLSAARARNATLSAELERGAERGPSLPRRVVRRLRGGRR